MYTKGEILLCLNRCVCIHWITRGDRRCMSGGVGEGGVSWGLKDEHILYAAFSWSSSWISWIVLSSFLYLLQHKYHPWLIFSSQRIENWINVLSLYKSFFLHLSMTWCDREWRIWILAHYELGLTICQLCDLGSHVNYHIVVVQSLSCVQLFATPWTAELQASLSVSWSLPKLTSIDLVMPSNHLILCCPLLLLPSIFSTE